MRRAEMEGWMGEALAEARLSDSEVPVGAIVVKDGTVIGRAHNQRETDGPFAHAEMLAMQRAFKKTGDRRLKGCTLFVTMEPCPMCAGGLIMAQADACVFGAFDEKQGCCGSVYCLPEDGSFCHRVQCVGGIREEECAETLREFFARRRETILPL